MPITVTRVPESDLRRYAESVFQADGVDAGRAALLADGIVQGALRGHPGQGQGMRRVPHYHERIVRGEIDIAARPRIVAETTGFALFDAGNGFGQVAAVEAMRAAIERAATIGNGMAGVRHSNHLGIAAYTAMVALEAGQIGICLSNAGPEMAPWGGLTPVLGTNPWGVAIPTGGEFPIVLDMALTTSGKGMIRWHAAEGLPIPDDWALTSDGRRTTDPIEADTGPLLPIGAFKGAGLSIVTDVLAGVLTGAAFGMTPYTVPGNHDVGHFMIAIDIERWMPKTLFFERLGRFIDEIKGAERLSGVEEIYLPGELEHRRTVERLAQGVPVPDDTLADLHRLARELGLPVTLPAPAGRPSQEVER